MNALLKKIAELRKRIMKFERKLASDYTPTGLMIDCPRGVWGDDSSVMFLDGPERWQLVFVDANNSSRPLIELEPSYLIELMASADFWNPEQVFGDRIVERIDGSFFVVAEQEMKASQLRLLQLADDALAACDGRPNNE